ncbi:diguanylate cyclase [Desulfovulcanus sp.]
MKKVLVVEDSNFFGMVIKNKIQTESNFYVTWTKSLSDTVKELNKTNNNFFAAVLDFNLPDAPEGEIIDKVISKGIPSIVFTSNVSKNIREFVWSKKVVDYILKDDPNSVEYLIATLKRLEKNPDIKILVVDDSPLFRKSISDLLKNHKYTVLTATNGKEALEAINEHPDIKMVITDFNMPEMDGFTLTQKIREKYSMEELAIIGISSERDTYMPARFLKYGANDFIIKQSFLTEEFYCRVIQHLESLERLQTIKKASIKDFLTGLYNRRYFFDFGQKLFASAKRENLSLTCAMIDIDHFKKVNDTYGHKVGDLVLQHVASTIKNRMRGTDIIARLGGEEFCILAVNLKENDAKRVFEELRQTIEKSPLEIDGGQKIKVTISIGVVTELADNLENMVNKADALLYEAKNRGRNKVIVNKA